MSRIDLNADLGESFGPWRMGRDAELLQIVTSANVACGMHASDPAEMLRTVRSCRENGVGIGAHPGFDDLRGFGRRRISGSSDEELAALVIYQIGALQAIAGSEGAALSHVKLHGAFSNMACEDRSMAANFVAAVRKVSAQLPIMAVAATELENAAHVDGGPFIREVFADRAYLDNGQLMPRSQTGAVVHDPETAAQNVLRMVEVRAVTSVNGKIIPIDPQSVCVHGDSENAVELATRVRATLEKAGVTVRGFWDQ